MRVLIGIEEAGPQTPADAAALAAAPPALHSGRVVEWFVETMLDALPRLHRHWLRFTQFFQLLFTTANNAGAPMTALLLRRGAIGRLIDFALGGRSPHPELNDPAYAAALLLLDSPDPTTAYLASTAKPEVRLMGSDFRVPDFGFLIRALAVLTLASATPAGLTDAPGALPPQLPLSRIDAEMLTSRQLMHVIAGQLVDHASVALFTPLVRHLLWGARVDAWVPPAAGALASATSDDGAAGSAAGDDEAEEAVDAAKEDVLAASERLDSQLPMFGVECVVQVRLLLSPLTAGCSTHAASPRPSCSNSPQRSPAEFATWTTTT